MATIPRSRVGLPSAAVDGDKVNRMQIKSMGFSRDGRALISHAQSEWLVVSHAERSTRPNESAHSLVTELAITALIELLVCHARCRSPRSADAGLEP